MSVQLINSKTECYLSPMAQKAVDELVRVRGLDRDLAIGVLEEIWPEEMIYQLEEASDGE